MIIGFTGSMGVGKSLAVRTLEGYLYPKFTTLSKLAQPLYDIQEYAYQRIESAYKRPEGFIKDRKLLQWLGTEWGRDTLSKTLWVDVWKADVEVKIFKGYEVICDDVRFDEEAQAIKALGGKIILITSDKTAQRINTEAGIKAHASESGISKHLIDAHIVNNGSVEEYEEKLYETFRLLGVES